MISYYDDITRIIEKVADIPVDEMTEESSLVEDLDISSFEIMSIVSEVERKFVIKIKSSELVSVDSIKDLMELVASKSIKK